MRKFTPGKLYLSAARCSRLDDNLYVNKMHFCDVPRRVRKLDARRKTQKEFNCEKSHVNSVVLGVCDVSPQDHVALYTRETVLECLRCADEAT